MGFFWKLNNFPILEIAFYKFWISGSDICLLNQDVEPSCLHMPRKACRREGLPPLFHCSWPLVWISLEELFYTWAHLNTTSLKWKGLNEQHGLQEVKTERMMLVFLFLAKYLHCFLLVQEAPWRSPILCCCEFCARPIKAKPNICKWSSFPWHLCFRVCSKWPYRKKKEQRA